MKKTNHEAQTNEAHRATAQMKDLAVSSKHCIEICNRLRYHSVEFAKKYLSEVAELKRAVSFKSFVRNVGHKRGMSTGRFPEKAARQFLILIKSVEANAQSKGLDVSNLKITRLLSNRASIPMTGGRQDGTTHRTHLEIEVQEGKAKKKTESKTEAKKVDTAEAKVEKKEGSP